MGRRYRRGRRYGSSSRTGSYSPGRERALQHIEDARRLSTELGGTDTDVKDYFFTLPPSELQRVLSQYQARHGAAAREYAEATIPKWRTGVVTMSGTVAERLFALLPPQMPTSAKYRLTENLWKHVGPTSKKRMRVGLDTPLDDILAAIRGHIEDVVVQYRVPDNLERRFHWLSAGDVRVKQDLLNHLRQMEKALVVEGARLQLPVMINHVRSGQGEYTHRLSQTLVLGKHELEILLDRSITGVRLEQWAPVVRKPASASDEGGVGSFWFWAIAVIVVLYLLAQ